MLGSLHYWPTTILWSECYLHFTADSEAQNSSNFPEAIQVRRQNRYSKTSTLPTITIFINCRHPFVAQNHPQIPCPRISLKIMQSMGGSLSCLFSLHSVRPLHPVVSPWLGKKGGGLEWSTWILILAMTVHQPGIQQTLSGNYFQLLPSFRFHICKMGIILGYPAKLIIDKVYKISNTLKDLAHNQCSINGNYF